MCLLRNYKFHVNLIKLLYTKCVKEVIVHKVCKVLNKFLPDKPSPVRIIMVDVDESNFSEFFSCGQDESVRAVRSKRFSVFILKLCSS